MHREKHVSAAVFIAVMLSLFHHALQSILCRASRRIFGKGEIRSHHPLLQTLLHTQDKTELLLWSPGSSPSGPVQFSGLLSPTHSPLTPNMPATHAFSPPGLPDYSHLRPFALAAPSVHDSLPPRSSRSSAPFLPSGSREVSLLDLPPPRPASSTLHGLICFVFTTLMLPGFPSLVHLLILS